jgi:phospholipid/cholesterol/gamma-HCH transport system substrate-binding protein
MERNANYFLVGLISTLLLIGLVVFFVWLGGSKLSRDYDVYDIVFQGPVRGVATGGEVDFNGIKVGSVTKIGIDPKNSQLVVARVNITPDVPIRQDSYATLEPQGITGVNYIQITAGTPSKPLLKETVPDGVIPKLTSRRDTISDLLSSGTFIAQRAVQALDQLNKLLSNDNIHKLNETLSDVEAVTAEARAHKEIIGDAQKALEDTDASIRQIGELAQSSNALINGGAKTTLGKLDAALDEVRGATHDVRVDLDKLDRPTQTFAETGLPQLTAAIESLRTAADHLDRLLGEVQANPRGLIGKAPPKEVQVKP